jgi:hypothetical protein
LVYFSTSPILKEKIEKINKFRIIKGKKRHIWTVSKLSKPANRVMDSSEIIIYFLKTIFYLII